MTNQRDAAGAAALLPCPWCKAEASFSRDDDPGYPVGIEVHHIEPCPLGFVSLAISYPSEAEAANVWNKRASLPAATEQEPVATDDHAVLIAAGFDDYAARCAVKTGPEGVFCHAYFYSDGQWRFQTGGIDLHMPDGKVLTCVLTKRLYSHPAPSDQEKLIAELVDGMQKLRTTAVLLLNNSEGCAANHHGGDMQVFGMPQWLTDCRSDIDAATTLITRARQTGGGA